MRKDRNRTQALEHAIRISGFNPLISYKIKDMIPFVRACSNLGVGLYFSPLEISRAMKTSKGRIKKIQSKIIIKDRK